LFLAMSLAVLAVAAKSYAYSGSPDWQKHHRFSEFAQTLTGLEIFVGTPLMWFAMNRRRRSQTPPETGPGTTTKGWPTPPG
jgi:hypothetical protein